MATSLCNPSSSSLRLSSSLTVARAFSLSRNSSVRFGSSIGHLAPVRCSRRGADPFRASRPTLRCAAVSTIVQSEFGTMLAEFVAYWCGPCRVMVPVIDWASQYERSSLYIMNIMEPLLQLYTERAASPAARDGNELSVLEGQITWIVHIIAAILKIRQTVGCSTESQEIIDAKLAARVLRLINVTDSGLHSQKSESLGFSILMDHA